MKNLQEYLYKNVIITDINGAEHSGYADFYESEYDSGYDEPSIGITPEGKKTGIEFPQSDIKSIKIID